MDTYINSNGKEVPHPNCPSCRLPLVGTSYKLFVRCICGARVSRETIAQKEDDSA